MSYTRRCILVRYTHSHKHVKRSRRVAAVLMYVILRVG